MSNSICRLCLKKDPFLIDIFSKDYEKMFEISIVIATHFAIQVEEVGSFSKHICSDCWNKIKEFHLFYCYVNSQQLTLRERDIEFITLKPELNILENKIKSEWNNTQKKNVTEISLPQLQSLPSTENYPGENFCNNHEEDHDFEPSSFPIISDDDDEDDDLPLSKLFKAQSQEKDTSDSEVKSQKHKKIKANTSRTKKKIKGNGRSKNMTPENHELIKLYFDLKCDLCPTVFGDTTLVEAIEHYKLVHKTEGYLKCCEKKFYRFYRLLEHIKTHTNPNISCDECTKSFCTKSGLKRHKDQEHLPVGQSLYKCDDCPKSFTRKKLLIKHRRYHMKPEERTFICDICNKAYHTAVILRAHKKIVHSNSEVICEICAKIYKNRGILKQHMKEHEGNPYREQCDICQKWLASKFSVKYHKSRVHTTQTEVFKCPVCGKLKPNQAALNTHVNFQHGEKTHKCTICEKSFRKLNELKEHIAVHTGVDLYTCTFCPMAFKFKANFYAHRKRMHPNELALMQKSIEENYAKEKQQLKGTTSS